jgi:hypothetical protein
MAQLLVKASGHWMDKLTEEEVARLSEQELESYYARSQVGDVIVVRGDDHVWGGAEGLPDFVVIKIPDVKEGDVKHYEETLDNVKDVANTIEVSKTQWDSLSAKTAIMAEQKIKSYTVAETKTESYILDAVVEQEYMYRRRKHAIDSTVFKQAVDNHGYLELRDLSELKMVEKVIE